MSFLRNLLSFSRSITPVNFSLVGTDIHSHLIPGIDDGANTLETSIMLIRGLIELGYSRIITTPHVQGEFFQNTPHSIQLGLEQVKRELSKQNLNIQIEAAAEYLLDEKFGEKIEQQQLLTFGKKYVLVEMSYFNEYPQWRDYFFNLQLAGYKIILAHPERYSYFFRNWARYEDLKDRGVFFQVNIMSLTGHYSSEVKRIAEKLIENGMVEFIGTDLHNPDQLQILQSARYERSLKNLIESGKLLNSSL